MPSNITIFDIATGAIRGNFGVYPGQEDAGLAEGEAWIEGFYQGRLDPLTLAELPLLEFSPVIETNRISNIPAGTTAIVGGNKYVVNDGEIVFDLESLQTVQVFLYHPLYQPLFDPFLVPTDPEAP